MVVIKTPRGDVYPDQDSPIRARQACSGQSSNPSSITEV